MSYSARTPATSVRFAADSFSFTQQADEERFYFHAVRCLSQTKRQPLLLVCVALRYPTPDLSTGFVGSTSGAPHTQYHYACITSDFEMITGDEETRLVQPALLMSAHVLADNGFGPFGETTR